MDYKKRALISFFLFAGILMVIHGCNTKSSKSKNELFYVDILNGDDSVKHGIAKAVFGKVAFYKDKHLTLLSKNFITEDFPEYQAYEAVSLLPAKIEPGTKKVTVEFTGNFTVDSTYYAIRQFAYRNDQWKKISDIGFIKAMPRYNDEPLKNKMPVDDLAKAVAEAIAESTHSR